MGEYIMAVDQGTTSSRAILFDRDMRIINIAQEEFRQIFPQAGWVEHNPNEILDSQTRVMADCLKNARVSAGSVAAIGITNQRETTVVWDKTTGEPVYNALVWQDRRTAPLCESFQAAGHLPLIREKTGLLLDPYFSATKIRWLLDTVPGAREKAEKGQLLFGTIDSWLLWNFTKGRVHATDPSNASRSLLFNIHTLAWDEDLLSLFQIPPSMLPTVLPSSGLFGHLDAEFLGCPIPITGIAGDQMAATFGNACLEPGMVKNTYGTGCFMLMNTGRAPRPSAHNLLTTIGWQIPSQTAYALEGSIFMAGALIQWLRDGLKLISHSGEVESLASTVPDNGGLFLVPAFVGLGAPYWDSHATGLLIGLNRGTERGHIARAALEAIALQTLDIMDAMVADSGITVQTLRADGGASRNNMLMQFQADILGVPVERPQTTETTALGAACLAGLATGFWSDLSHIQSHWSLNRRFEPKMPDSQRQELQEQWHNAINRSKGWRA